MDKFIAQTNLVGITAEGERQEIEVKIGVPYKINHEDNIEEWACPVSLQPLFKQLRDVSGGDSFQALCLAAGLVIDLLTAYKEKGGKLTLKGGDEFPLNAYWFRPIKDT